MGPICTGDTAFSHETAARIVNLPLPAREMPTDVLQVIREVIRCCDLDVVAPAHTFLDLAVTLCRGGQVVAGDCIATRAKSFDRIHDAMSRRSSYPDAHAQRMRPIW